MKRIFNLLTFVAFAITISLTSCKTDGCTDATAINYDDKADNDDGTCEFERDAFIGTYNNSVDGCEAGSSFDMTISAATESTSTISFSNFGGFGYSIKATVIGNNITLISGSLGTGTILLSGTGSLNGNILTILYTYEDDFGTETCQITATK